MLVDFIFARFAEISTRTLYNFPRPSIPGIVFQAVQTG
jgi:hypothetical protein